ncbi:hypothetical protein N7501_008467 [Penicillium viridicatum]|nr:hypothetical protein N7501_008467 [Penicillium viridicatum]
MPGRTRPVEKIAKASAQCSVEVAAYGKCVVTDYNSVHKDMCAKEFMRLKNCYLVGDERVLRRLKNGSLKLYVGSIKSVGSTQRFGAIWVWQRKQEHL